MPDETPRPVAFRRLFIDRPRWLIVAEINPERFYALAAPEDPQEADALFKRIVSVRYITPSKWKPWP